MHDTALELGRRFFVHYAANTADAHVLDIGSMDVNGSLRTVCPPEVRYTGVDMADGAGVDVVLDDPYILPFDDDSFSAIVTSSCFEHSDMFWLLFNEAIRVLRPGGYLYVNAPSNGWYHPHPQDCWRFYPDSGLSFVAWGKRQGLDVHLMESFIAPRSADSWNDMVMVFRKGDGLAKVTPIVSTLPGAGAVRVVPDVSVLQNGFHQSPDMQIIGELVNAINHRNHHIAELEKLLAQTREAIAAFVGARAD